MFKLDNDFLVTMGLGGLPVEEKNRLLQMIYERLEMNVGMRLAEKMTDAQLDEFEGFIDRNDEAGALKWLETNFPNYKDVVAEELEKLKGEVQTAAPQILASSQQSQMPGQTPQAAAMPPIGQAPAMPGVPMPPEPQATISQTPPMQQNLTPSDMPPTSPGFSPQPPAQSFTPPPAPSQPQPAFQTPPSVQPMGEPAQPFVPPSAPSAPPMNDQPMTMPPSSPMPTPPPAQPTYTPPPADFNPQ